MKKLLILAFVAGTVLFAADAPQPRNADNANKGGPAVERRPFTNQEIVSTLRALGATVADPNNPTAAVASGVSCDVEDSGGLVTQTVKWAGFPSAPVYWLRYQPPSNTTTATVTFFVLPLFHGSPLAAQAQVYNPNSQSEVLAPFAIPFWQNSATNGLWVLFVKNNLSQTATFFFQVTN